MQALIRVLPSLSQRRSHCVSAMLAMAPYAFLQLDIEAYPDPSPRWSSLSAVSLVVARRWSSR